MSALKDLLKASAETVLNMKLDAIISIAGGDLSKDAVLLELREFFANVDNNHIKNYVNQCLDWNKKDNKTQIGFVLQDLVNEIGKRLGYDVTYGLYKGHQGENGLDGLWKCVDDGSYIIMESKTTDSFVISPDIIIGYRDKLIADKKVSRKNCSMLLVLGKITKGNTIVSTVKGSKGSEDIRIISVESLCRLLDIYESTSSAIIKKKIHTLVKPYDYTQVDSLIELVFDNWSEKEATEDKHGGDKKTTHSLPKLDNSIESTCTFVKTAMKNLSDAGYLFNEDDLKFMQTDGFTKKCFKNSKALHLPFLITTDKPRYIKKGQPPRYWKDVLSFNGQQFFAMSQWDNHDGSRERFIDWYNSL